MGLLSCQQGHQNPEGSRFCSVCGESLVEPEVGSLGASTPLPPGKRLRDRYVIRQTLGEGGFGRTYLIEDTGRFDEHLVLKEFLPSTQGTFALKKSVELFQREAVTLYQLQHAQIPRFWEIFEAESRLFLVEDFVEGQTYEDLLTERIRNRTAFSETEALHLLRDLLPVLTYIHREGIVHRDISPDNIILSAKLQLPVLIDMGAAKQSILNATTTVRTASAPRPTMIGKTGYAPDEQIRLGLVAPYSDLYALAVTAIVLMTGKQPNQLLDGYTLGWNWEKHITVNPTFAQVINRMLAARPNQRFQSAEAVLQAIAPLLHGSTQTEVSAPGRISAAPRPTPETLVTPTPLPRSSPNPGSSNPVPIASDHFAPPLTPMNNSGSGGAIVIPAGVEGWNWGAFLLGPIWGITNKVWISLLFIPVHLFFYLLSPAMLAFSVDESSSYGDHSGFIVSILIIAFNLLIASPLGFKGNEWAWKKQRWPSIEQFRTRQQQWALVSWIISSLVFSLWFLLLLFVE